MATKFRPQSKVQKAASRLYMIIDEFFEKWYNYSLKLAVYNTAWWIGNYSPPLVKLQFWGTRKITQWMDDFLHSHHLIPDITNKMVSVKDYRIWVFWWQGRENMPKLVNACYRQLTKNNGNVVLLTKDNCKDYCHIPAYIYEKVEKGYISFTHFSDILRVSLLAENGGLWVDSTCWVSQKIPQEVYDSSFISPRTNNLPNFPWWSNSRWCSWCMGTNQKNNPLLLFAQLCFFAFFENNNKIPFYLFTDYLYDYAYRYYSDVKKMIDGTPENNTKRNELHLKLNKPWNKDEYLQLCKNNWVFKLSYKTLWQSVTSDGKPTFYQILVKGELDNQ